MRKIYRINYINIFNNKLSNNFLLKLMKPSNDCVNNKLCLKVIIYPTDITSRERMCGL